jgi:hypothetical protein
MLALVILLAGAAASAVVAVSNVNTPLFFQAVIATLIQLAVAAGLRLNVAGARVAAVGVLLLQFLLLMLLALVFLAFVALPFQGGGPLPGHDFNPVWFALTMAAVVLIIGAYLLAFRSAWRSHERMPVSA